MYGTKLIMLVAFGLIACEGGSFKKRNCKSCETVTYGQQTQPRRIVNQVCGDNQVSAYITANTISNSSLTVVTTCK
ncbi:hypothetical protein HNV11_07970 [Spirosoma taeanense]|uniref:Uncharacterized protein n=1 Tax=Spirosoma taeanense TaxID=2735870 RepID=A0A6M5Y767_9BACT|nr:hypothetical protein [Spirosoma taeanense]QJW89324.1 hypothetical protein HNV11_07970 [Spirosoma taeanense]